MDNHFCWLAKHMNHQRSVTEWGRKRKKQVVGKKKKKSGQCLKAERIFWGQRSLLLAHLTCLSSHFPLSSYCYCYYFHRRQEVALSQPIASLPAPYQAMAGCLSWSGFHPNRSPDLLMRARERERERKKKKKTQKVRVCDMLEARGGGEVKVRADLWQRCKTLFDDIWIWFHLHGSHLLRHAGQWASITDCCKRLRLGVDVFAASHPPALAVPVHDFKLFPQPPTEGEMERKSERVNMTKIQVKRKKKRIWFCSGFSQELQYSVQCITCFYCGKTAGIGKIM